MKNTFRILTAVLASVALVVGLGLSATAAPLVQSHAGFSHVDSDTNGSNPGTHTFVQTNPYNGARVVVYWHREFASFYPSSDYVVKIDGVYAQDKVEGEQFQRVLITGERNTNNPGDWEQGLFWSPTVTTPSPFVDVTAPALTGPGQVGGWDTLGPVLTGNGPLAQGSPSVLVQVVTPDWNCRRLGVLIDGTDNQVLGLGCNA